MRTKFNTYLASIALLTFTACGDENNTTNNNSNNGITITIPTTATTATTGTTGTTSTTATSGTTGTTAGGPQCDNAGEVCEPSGIIKAGFVCVRLDPNRDAICQTSCIDPRDPGLDPDAPYTCADGQICQEVSGGGFACRLSECTGLLDVQSCAATETCLRVRDVVHVDPNDRESEIIREGNSNVCVTPTNPVGLGETCTALNGCEVGLACVGICVLPCGDDATCTTEGEGCVGEEVDFLGPSVGYCGEKCTPYKADSGCEGADICVPQTSTEGICNDNEGTVGPYEACSTPSACGPNLRCLGFQNGLGLCLPFCDPTLATPAAQAATCEGVDAHCINVAEEPRPSTGYCIASCSPDDYGNNSCPGTGNACLPINQNTVHACYPGTGTADLGETCDSTDRTLGCKEGLQCSTDSTGAGTCTSYCEPTPSAVNLVCQADETCSPIGETAFNFGICGKTCTPTSHADENCPANKQSCLTRTVGDTTSICSDSGNVALGAACTSIVNNTCVNGALCVNDWLRSYGVGDIRAPGQCTKRCDLFADDTGCDGTDVCSPNLVYQSETVGYCIERGPDAAPLAPCEVNKACGATATCFGSNPGQCLPWCLLSTGAGCGIGEICRDGFGGGFLYGVCT